jgi:acetyl esterase/lipase
MRLRAAFVIAAAATLVAGAVVVVKMRSDGSAAHAAPALDAFYSVPSRLPSNVPGALFKSERVNAPTVHGTFYRVMYGSRSAGNEPVAVTGLIIVPTKPPPPGGYRVVSVGHGTTGLGARCAPSRSALAVPSMTNAMLDRGWIVAATDYEGLGTGGVLGYLAGVPAARDAIDIVRAAQHLVAHVSNQYVMMGHSEGGHTALFVLEIAESYAPDLHLAGVIAAAPPSHFESLYESLKTGNFRYYLPMIVVGLHATYGDAAPLDPLLTERGRAIVPVVERVCLTLPEFSFYQPAKQLLPYRLGTVSIDSLFKTSPFAIPAWRTVLEANDPASFTSAHDVPLLIPQGGSDEQIPVRLTQQLATHLCALGQRVQTWIYPGQNHAGVIFKFGDDWIHWTAERFANASAPASYEPLHPAEVRRTSCPSHRA